MKPAKKIVSFTLVIAMAFSGICVKAESSHKKMGLNQYGGISKKAKIIGGISAVGLAAAGMFGLVYCFQHRSLPVLIIGGDKNARETLINKLKDPNPMNKNPKEKDSLASCISKKTARGANGVYGVGSTRARFENWKISECDANDACASKLAEDARLIIAILTDEESVKVIDDIIVKPKLSNHMVVSIVDENYPSVCYYDERGEKRSYNTLADEFSENPIFRYSENIDIPSHNKDGKNGLLLNLGFYWNRNDDTFVCFRWST